MSLISWGNYPRTQNSVHKLLDIKSLKEKLSTDGDFIAFGNGRSYGDSAISDNIIHTKPYDYFLDFDEIDGVLEVRSGALLSDILESVVKHGWFLKVTPGTKLITVGGAIASDIHGKNHHIEGCFSECLEEFTIMMADGEIKSAKKGDELFLATCGGMGLTGVILTAKITLKKINSQFIR